MENHLPYYQQKNNWRRAFMILVAISVFLLGGLILSIIKNINQDHKNLEMSTELTHQENLLKDCEEATTIACADNSETGKETQNYFVIREWGIKFAVPELLKTESLSYTATDHTLSIPYPNNGCLLDGTSFVPYVYISRFKNKEVAGLRYIGQAGEYYYFFQGHTDIKSYCSDGSSVANKFYAEIEDAMLNMITQITVIE